MTGDGVVRERIEYCDSSVVASCVTVSSCERMRERRATRRAKPFEVGVIGAADDFLCTTLLDGDEQIGRSCGLRDGSSTDWSPAWSAGARAESVKLAWAMTVWERRR